jgi:UDP-2-acetamido-3-amino-2,3-dideoxy-glucuronate N-acetyltransferase
MAGRSGYTARASTARGDWILPPETPPPTIHPTADVADDARVGPATAVWHHAQIREGATIGAECTIGRDVYIDTDVRIGDRVKIQNGALVYRGVSVASGVFIGPGAILTNDRYPRAVTLDGRRAGPDDWEVGTIDLREGCSIGAGAIVVAGTDVGRFATVGAGAVVTKDVPDQALVAGNPAHLIGWVCACGRRLVDTAGSPAGAAAEGDLLCPADGSRYVLQGERCTPAELAGAAPSR